MIARSPSGIASETGELHRLLVESVQDYAIFALDPYGYILSWNDGAQRIKGYTAEEVIGKHFSIFYPADLVAEGFPDFELRTAAVDGRFEDEGWRIRKNGSHFWANVVITALHNPAGELVGFGKVTRDLTERREAEQELRDSEESFRLLVDGVKDYAIFMLDPAGRVATWNEGARRIKGYERDEIIGQSFTKFYPPEDVAARKPERELAIAKRVGKYEEEGWRVRRDGQRFWASVLITALRNQAGELVGYAKVTRDLTERRAAEEAAAASRTAAEAQRRSEEANRIKSQFLAAMSHELRTPLNAIGGYADLLLMGISGPVTPTQTEQLGRIKRSQEHLLGIINDILNFSRIEAGQLTYDLGAVPLHAVVDSVTQMVTPQAQGKGVRLEASDCPKDVVAWGDRSKVEQIVLNLVGNAVKFTGPGGLITLSCEHFDDATVAVRVRDTGCGIPSDHLHAIFEPFVQVGRSLTSTGHGTGLGLAISRDLALAMHGDIVAESTVDVGSVFTMTLPRTSAQG